jgi:hypothetical protein
MKYNWINKIRSRAISIYVRLSQFISVSPILNLFFFFSLKFQLTVFQNVSSPKLHIHISIPTEFLQMLSCVQLYLQQIQVTFITYWNVCLLILLACFPALPGLATNLRADSSTAVLRHREKWEIWGSHGGVCEEYHLLGYDGIQSGIRLLTNVLPRVVRQENATMGPEESETKNDWAVEGQQQITRTEHYCLYSQDTSLIGP